MKQIQKKVQDFVRTHDIETDIKSRMLDLQSEIGELAKEILKSTHYGKTEFIPDADWENELGDALFALICLANQTDVYLDSALKKALQKYERRLAEKGNVDSGR